MQKEKKIKILEGFLMSFMYKRNENGPSIEPCGTPHVIISLFDNLPLTFTV